MRLARRISQLANPDAAEMHLVTVVLEDDVTTPSRREAGNRLVLALVEQRAQARRAEIEFQHLDPVQPVLSVISAKENACAVPLTDGVQSLGGAGCDDIVEGAGAVADTQRMRAAAVLHNICLVTTLSAASAAVNGITALKAQALKVRSLQAHFSNPRIASRTNN